MFRLIVFLILHQVHFPLSTCTSLYICPTSFRSVSYNVNLSRNSTCILELYPLNLSSFSQVVFILYLRFLSLTHTVSHQLHSRTWSFYTDLFDNGLWFSARLLKPKIKRMLFFINFPKKLLSLFNRKGNNRHISVLFLLL